MSTKNKTRIAKVLSVLESAGFILFVTWLAYSGDYVAAFGWGFAALGWWAFDREHGYFDELMTDYSNHLKVCEKKINTYIDELQECREKLNGGNFNQMPFDVDVDNVLKIGRDFQKSDTWCGATYDTAKLLCDTIEMLQNKLNKRGNRNCDVYDTLDAAMAACYKDREYCSYASAERKSVISFMLQDVKDNSFNKTSDGKGDGK